MTQVGGLAAWTGPALVVAVVARVMVGGLEAPLFILAVLAAPLLALLAEPAPGALPSGAALPIALVMAVCVLGSSIRAMTDLGHILGWPTWGTLGSAVALMLLATLWAPRDRVSLVALGLGVGALLAAVVGFGHVVDASPWAAWSRVASRSAFELTAGSPWTREGFQALEPVSLTLTEPRQLTVMTAGVYRVTEHDRAQPIIREWRLTVGDSLAMRPGDTLSIPSGGRVRFEAGTRLPVPASGMAWADGLGAPRARSVAGWVGLAVTLAGGAMALVRPLAPLARGAALLTPVTALGVVLAAASWGVYAVDAAPELSIGMPPGAALVRLVPTVVPEPWRSRLSAAVLVALVALLVAVAAALHQRLVDLADLQAGRVPGLLRRRAVRSSAWVVLVIVAAAAGVWVTEGWSLLLHGMGLGAATVLGPLLATGDAPDARRANLAGALAGVTVFVLTPHATEWLAPLRVDAVAAIAQYPALIAAPAAWLVAMAIRALDDARAEMVAALRRH